MTLEEFKKASSLEGLPMHGALYWVYSADLRQFSACVYRHSEHMKCWRVHNEEHFCIPNVTHYIRLPDRM